MGDPISATLLALGATAASTAPEVTVAGTALAAGGEAAASTAALTAAGYSAASLGAGAAAAGGGTLGTLSLIGSGLSTGISAIGALTSGRAQSQAAAYQAQVARNNARIANQNAALAIQTGQADVARQQQITRSVVGSAIAGEAGSGLEVGTGSPAELTAGVTEAKNLETMTAAHDALLQAYGYRTQGTSYQAEAGLQALKAGQATTAGDISAAGTLIGGAGQLASKWAQFQNKGVIPAVP